MNNILRLILIAMIALFSTHVSAKVIEGNWIGAHVLIVNTGGIQASSTASDSTVSTDGSYDSAGFRTAVHGTFQYNTELNEGSMLVSKAMFNSWPLDYTNVTFKAIGDGLGGAGSLIIISYTVGYGFTSNPVLTHVVADASGFLGALNHSNYIGNIITHKGTVSCIDDMLSPYTELFPTFVDAVGQIPIAATSLNVNQDENGELILGGLPVVEDNLCGSPKMLAPHAGGRVVLDVMSIVITNTLP